MTVWDAYYALMAFVATIPVIASFTAGAGVVLICVVWVLLGEPHPKTTAEHEETRCDLETAGTCNKEEAALGDSDLPPEARLKGVYTSLEEFPALLAYGGFLGEG